VTGPDKTSKHLGIGDAVTIPFNEAGTVYYECTLHPQQMRGKVIVTQ
jgi:plastocyanin